MASSDYSPHEDASPNFNDNFVTVVVGHEQSPFSVHKELLSRHSMYFAARLSGRWDDDQPVVLPDTNPSTFQTYAEFLYSPLALHRILSPEHQTLETGVDALVRLYVLGEYLDDRTLRNHVMYQFFQLLEVSADFRWSVDIINMIFEDTYEGCNLQEYVVADHLFDTSAEWIEDNADVLSPRFTKRLLKGWASKSQQPKIVYQHPNDSKFDYWQIEGMSSAKRHWEGSLQEPTRRQKRATQIAQGRSVSALPLPLSLACTTPLPPSSASSVGSPTPISAGSPVERKGYEKLTSLP